MSYFRAFLALQNLSFLTVCLCYDAFCSSLASENKSATGVIDAGYELAQLYEQGLGVEQDVDRAIALYQEAAEYGHEAASTALERLGK